MAPRTSSSPNAGELAFATDMPTDTDAQVEAALARALELSQCRAVLVTRAAKGMSRRCAARVSRHFRRAPPEVYDTVGAGDTALAAPRPRSGRQGSHR